VPTGRRAQSSQEEEASKAARDRIIPTLREIEVGTGEVARLGALMRDAEGDAAQRVAEEGGLPQLDLAAAPVGTDLVEHQQRIGAVAAVAEAVVGQHPEAAGLASHRLDAGEALHGLADEGEGDAGRAAAMRWAGVARDATGVVHPQIAGAGELAGDQGVARRIGRRQRHGEGRQDGVAGKQRLETLVGQRRRGKADHGCRGKQYGSHLSTSPVGVRPRI